jgi:hypothetical protein
MAESNCRGHFLSVAVDTTRKGELEGTHVREIEGLRQCGVWVRVGEPGPELRPGASP